MAIGRSRTQLPVVGSQRVFAEYWVPGTENWRSDAD